MESFALFANAKALGKKAACLLTISDSFVSNVATTAEERQNNFTNMMKIVQLICDCGGEYVKKASTADIFVKYHLIEDGEERRCSKYEFVQEEINKGKQIAVVEFEVFLNLLGFTEEKLNELPIEDYEYLMDEKYKREKLA